MVGYQNTIRKVIVLPEAEREANKLNLIVQLGRLKKMLANRERIKDFKKIIPKTANTYEARLTIKYRAFIIFENNEPIIFKVGDHL